MRFICCFRRPREEAALERVEQQDSTRLQRPSERATREGAPSPDQHANAKWRLADAPRAGRCRYRGSSRIKNLDVRVDELKLRMVIILPKPPRRERSAHRRGTFLAMRRTTSAAPGPHVLGGRPTDSEVRGRTMFCSKETEVPWKDQSTRKISARSNPTQRVPSHAGELSIRRQA
jgi:hypothetical protein